MYTRCFVVLAIAGLTACGASARLPVSAGEGPHPVIPAPAPSLVPQVNYVKGKGWPKGEHPIPAEGLSVSPFATGLDHPRWIYVLPNGDVLIAETNAPRRPENNPGIKGWFTNYFTKRAGGAVPSANRITLLRDTDGDGVADVRSVFLAGLTSPFGMALVGHTLYIANTNALVKVPYTDGATTVTASPGNVTDLPAGRLNHHWTKNVISNTDGSKLYVAIGSNSNAAEFGIERERDRARIWEVDPATGAHRDFATGLRNPVGLAWVPETGKLWVAVNERDELGSDLVPDYMTAVTDGAFYGFPYSYFGKHVDRRVKPYKPDLVATALTPDYALGPHTASLGLAYTNGNSLPARFHSGMFVGQHGSWNRVPRSGYKVIFVPFAAGLPSGDPIDVLAGFVKDNGDALGRPVGVAIDKRGGLLVVDDVGNSVWRVTGSH
ncbi:MAG: sorbosone dehydrogenase family protein [Gemmatimonadaceae bacterium]|nr:sorbosone dehydrogenase family protein [Gemmatimonadaceae bacterium]